MNHAQLQAAVDEAKRFIARAELLKRTAGREPVKALASPSTLHYTDHPREQGAVKRASLDLTRALADLRRREGGAA